VIGPTCGLECQGGRATVLGVAVRGRRIGTRSGDGRVRVAPSVGAAVSEYANSVGQAYGGLNSYPNAGS